MDFKISIFDNFMLIGFLFWYCYGLNLRCFLKVCVLSVFFKNKIRLWLVDGGFEFRIIFMFFMIE